MIFNATFNNIYFLPISFIGGRDRVPGELTNRMCVFLLVTTILSQVSDQSYVCVPVSDDCPKPGK